MGEYAADGDRDPVVTDGTDRLAALRARIGAVARGGRSPTPPVPLGLRSVDGRAVDQGLPGGGIAACGLHEIADAALAPGVGEPGAREACAEPCAEPWAEPGAEPGLGEDGAATGFAAFLAGRLVRARGDRGMRAAAAVWIAADGGVYPPGLVRFGLSPDALVHVHAPRPKDRLWALEECLRSGAVAVAVADLDPVGMTAARRLQLAAEAGGAAALVLHRAGAARSGRGTGLPPSPALTRWRVASAPARPTPLPSQDQRQAAGGEQWRLDLVRCRDGRPGGWLVDWAVVCPGPPSWASVIATAVDQPWLAQPDHEPSRGQGHSEKSLQNHLEKQEREQAA